ncbi:hypothetical protein KSX_50920 [Ktedonospora formicarum]|uniref:Uncharacterized protein n=1 Tax=Ktedonospora formicarum TaxID=2778364 RepID=A0A8J3I934_9CHLR|nr:hypothetical protein KSX_50920 [Ktedonospora formicarum]
MSWLWDISGWLWWILLLCAVILGLAFKAWDDGLEGVREVILTPFLWVIRILASIGLLAILFIAPLLGGVVGGLISGMINQPLWPCTGIGVASAALLDILIHAARGPKR